MICVSKDRCLNCGEVATVMAEDYFCSALCAHAWVHDRVAALTIDDLVELRRICDDEKGLSGHERRELRAKAAGV